MAEATERLGIACAGNWIIDHVKMISVWPQQDTLANITSEEVGTGGSAYNVLVDLARFDVGVELTGVGLVGDDEDGARIIADCDAWGIDRSFLVKTVEAPTSYTDVMTVSETGRRTFFHNRGANALLGPEHIPVDRLQCRVLNLGYLLLLDRLDAADAEFGTVAARVLRQLREAGIVTVVDVVSEDSDRFASIVTPALKETDFCVVNEIEAGRTVGRDLRPGGQLDRTGMREVAQQLLDAGVRTAAVVHAPELSVAAGADGEVAEQSSHVLPGDFIVGTAGAGDAFLSGCLLGIHEGWGLGKSLRFATTAAATCLRNPTTTGGVGSAEEIWELSESLPYRE